MDSWCQESGVESDGLGAQKGNTDPEWPVSTWEEPQGRSPAAGTPQQEPHGRNPLAGSHTPSTPGERRPAGTT